MGGHTTSPRRLSWSVFHWHNSAEQRRYVSTEQSAWARLTWNESHCTTSHIQLYPFQRSITRPLSSFIQRPLFTFYHCSMRRLLPFHSRSSRDWVYRSCSMAWLCTTSSRWTSTFNRRQNEPRRCRGTTTPTTIRRRPHAAQSALQPVIKCRYRGTLPPPHQCDWLGRQKQARARSTFSPARPSCERQWPAWKSPRNYDLNPAAYVQIHSGGCVPGVNKPRQIGHTDVRARSGREEAQAPIEKDDKEWSNKGGNLCFRGHPTPFLFVFLSRSHRDSLVLWPSRSTGL